MRGLYWENMTIHDQVTSRGFSNFLFEHKLFITFQLLNFILNQIGRLVVKSSKFPTAAEHSVF